MDQELTLTIKKILNGWAYAYILMIMIAVPLYVEDNYFNIVQAKMHCFQFIMLIGVPIGLVLYIIYYFRIGRPGLKFNLMDKFLSAFALIVTVSCFLSEDISASFWGTDGWGIGAVSWLGLVLSYLLITRTLDYKEGIFIPVLIVHSIMIIIGIIQSGGTDLFSMHERMYENQIYSYISTMGQMNWWVGYLCLFVPFVFVLILEKKKTWIMLLYAFFWILLCAAMIMCSSDGLYLGIGVCLFFMIPYVLAEAQRMRRAGILLMIFGAVDFLMAEISCFSEMIRMINNGIAKEFTKTETAVFIIAAGVLFYTAGRFVWDRISEKVRSVSVCVLEGAMGMLSAGFLINTIITFNDRWGTRRGLIWRMSGELYAGYGIKNKLIGTGPEMLRYAYRDLSKAFGQTVLVSHSEPLQYLLTAGVTGLAVWVCVWASVIREYYKSEKEYTRPFFYALMAFLGQSLVNSANCLTLPLLFVMMSIYRVSLSKSDIVQ